ncbi:MAG: ECF transporter S component [Clostridia bacterium]|nr:ECF transporter S component [Clostridia bacterium]
MQNESGKVKRKNIWPLIVVLIVLVLAAGTYFRKYINFYIPTALIVILLMIPFFRSFEERKPDARELVTLAIMCAICVMSRVLFTWAPSFKPIAGLITITAICFGPSSGFMVGALSMLASNMMFGQGPWTVWQMFAFGMHGLVSGYLAKKGIFGEKKLVLTAVLSSVLYMLMTGPILDTSAIFLMPGALTIKHVLAIYGAGLPVNLSQAICTFITVFLLLKPMGAILNRLKVKYGILNQEI